MQTDFPRKDWIAEAEAVEWQLSRHRRALAENLRRTDRVRGRRRRMAAVVTTVGSALTIGLLMWTVA